MTKQWDAYEATIKNLYAENTLSVVRQIMIEKYGFKASTRAYRGRLIRWNVRKYNCRKRDDRAPSSASSSHDSSGSDLASPPAQQHLQHPQHQQHIDMRQRHLSNGHLAMPGRMSQQYGSTDGTTYVHEYVFSSSPSFPFRDNYATTQSSHPILLDYQMSNTKQPN
ncbi:hypothetical protein F4677DRAFT_426117, partial [Hypoxylon crocopeplum]